MRQTGFPLPVRALIIDRAHGVCEVCGIASPGMQVHHRRPRGMGGTRRSDTNTAAAGLYVCGFGGCHDRIESERTDSYTKGLLLGQHQDPALVPVLLHQGWVLLDNAGGYVTTEERA